MMDKLFGCLLLMTIVTGLITAWIGLFALANDVFLDLAHRCFFA